MPLPLPSVKVPPTRVMVPLAGGLRPPGVVGVPAFRLVTVAGAAGDVAVAARLVVGDEDDGVAGPGDVDLPRGGAGAEADVVPGLQGQGAARGVEGDDGVVVDDQVVAGRARVVAGDEEHAGAD